VDSTLVSLNATLTGGVIAGVLSTVTAVGDSTPPVISAVAAVNVGPTRATITWVTDEGNTSQGEDGPPPAHGSSTTLNASLVTPHSQILTGLAPTTLYHYRVKSRDAATNLATSSDKTFMTPAPPPPPPPSAPKKKKEGFFDSIINFFKHLF